MMCLIMLAFCGVVFSSDDYADEGDGDTFFSEYDDDGDSIDWADCTNADNPGQSGDACDDSSGLCCDAQAGFYCHYEENICKDSSYSDGDYGDDFSEYTYDGAYMGWADCTNADNPGQGGDACDDSSGLCCDAQAGFYCHHEENICKDTSSNGDEYGTPYGNDDYGDDYGGHYDCIGECHYSCHGDNFDGKILGDACTCLSGCDFSACGEEVDLSNFKAYVDNGCDAHSGKYGDDGDHDCIGKCHYSCHGDNFDGEIIDDACTCLSNCDFSACGEEVDLSNFYMYIDNGCDAHTDNNKGKACMGECPHNCVDGDFNSVTTDQCLCLEGCDMSSCDKTIVAEVKDFIAGGCMAGDDYGSGDYGDDGDYDCIGKCHYSCHGDNFDGEIVDDACTCLSSCDFSACGDEVDLSDFKEYIDNGCDAGKSDYDDSEDGPDCMGECPFKCVGGDFTSVTADQCLCLQGCDTSTCDEATVAKKDEFIASGCVMALGEGTIPDEFDKSAPTCMSDCPSKCAANFESITADECSCIQTCDISSCDDETLADVKEFIASGCVMGDDYSDDYCDDYSNYSDDYSDDYSDETAPACMSDCPSKCAANMQSITAEECSCIQGCDMSSCDEETVAKVKDFVASGCEDGSDDYESADTKDSDDYESANAEYSDDYESADVSDDYESADTEDSNVVTVVDAKVEVVVEYAEAAPDCMADSVCVNTCIPDPSIETIPTDACSCIRQCDLSTCSDDNKALIQDFLDAGCVFREVATTAFSCGRASAVRAGSTLDTFSFDGCGEGSGEFSLCLDVTGEVKTVGEIPAGQDGLQITLKSSTDVDIRLYDISEEFPRRTGGQAIVAWCEDGPAEVCGGAVLGLGDSAETQTYKGMEITYSGYAGDSTSMGNEYIHISGISTKLRMEVYAFDTGTVDVSYSWTDTQSDCCSGTAKCTGTFTRDIQMGVVDNLGTIPTGVKDLKISLDSEADLDIQLYSEATGTPIIAYDGAAGDHTGLGDLETGGTADYNGLSYTYSGWSGDGINMGNEFISVAGGATNLAMDFRVYAYDEGQYTVLYEFMR